MLEFKVEQKVFQIGKVSVSGVPGKKPVVLVGSIFYHGHKILKDEMTGEFDKKAAEELINLQDELREEDFDERVKKLKLALNTLNEIAMKKLFGASGGI